MRLTPGEERQTRQLTDEIAATTARIAADFSAMQRAAQEFEQALNLQPDSMERIDDDKRS